jgi:hypothetical protein
MRRVEKMRKGLLKVRGSKGETIFLQPLWNNTLAGQEQLVSHLAKRQSGGKRRHG